MGGRVIFRPIGFFFPFFNDRVGLPGLPPGPDLGLSEREGFTGLFSGLLVEGWVIPNGGEGGASAGSGAGGGANGAGTSAISSPMEGGTGNSSAKGEGTETGAEGSGARGGRSKEGAGGGANGGSSSAISSPKEGGTIGGN